MEVLRNLARRKLRSTLTIAGIVIGIFALTTMGAVAEHFNVLLGGGVTYYGSNVEVRGNSDTQSLLTIDVADRLRGVRGVSAVYPDVSLPARGGSQTSGSGVPDFIASVSPGEWQRSVIPMRTATGHALDPRSRGQVVLGASLAAEIGATPGRVITLPLQSGASGHRFKVVGVLAPTQTVPDSGAYVSLADAQMLLHQSMPAAVRDAVFEVTIVNGFTVYGPKGAGVGDLDRLADRINHAVPGVVASRPSTLVDNYRQSSATFTAVTTGAALLALIIGGLSVINTMLMSVAERVREIGLKKAVGARTPHILREYLTEAGMIGLVGGVAGFLLGVAVTMLLNLLGRRQNMELFLVTPTLAVVTIGFAVLLGIAAGLAPAWRAARMDPVQALRGG